MGELILVADDERGIADMIGRYLASAGYDTVLAYDGRSALRLARERQPACIVLDVNMPGLDGLDVVRELRKVSRVPVIFLSARVDETDRVLGLELGADDYVTKPFSPRELVSRIKAVLRRTSPAEDSVPAPAGARLVSGAVELDTARHTLRVSGKDIHLTAAQFDILALLMQSPGRVYSRPAILSATTGEAYDGYERTIDVQIKNIRKAMGDDGERPVYIGTVRGVGYKWLEQAGDA